MVKKDTIMSDLCCKEESCDNIESCNCQGICTCDDFMCDYEKSDCDDCCNE